MAAGCLIYRIQDREGRGPYRPGFSHVWSDREGPTPPTFMEEFGSDVLKLAPPSHHIGCGFRDLSQCARWFSSAERARLKAFGFELVKLEADMILGESLHQVIFSRRTPLAFGTRLVRWANVPLAQAA